MFLLRGADAFIACLQERGQSIPRLDQIVFQRHVAFEIPFAIALAQQVRLVNNPDGFADLDYLVESFDVLGVKANSAMTNAHADAVGLIRAVNQVARHFEFEYACAERVILSAWDQ